MCHDIITFFGYAITYRVFNPYCPPLLRGEDVGKKYLWSFPESDEKINVSFITVQIIIIILLDHLGWICSLARAHFSII